jgi:Family of unknown function (DUF5681)
VATSGNLKPFKPGQDGNPGGRPKGSCSVTAIIRQLLTDEEAATKLAKAVLSQAARGNAAAIKQVLDRTDGPVQQKVEFVIESAAVVDAFFATAASRMNETDYFKFVAEVKAKLDAPGEGARLSGGLAIAENG